jgi:hypothetical protein
MLTPQIPIGSGFNSASTAAEVITGIDLAGKTAIVTGGYSGLGREMRVSCGRRVRESSSQRAMSIGRRRR